MTLFGVENYCNVRVPDSEKTDAMCNRFHILVERDRQTDR